MKKQLILAALLSSLNSAAIAQDSRAGGPVFQGQKLFVASGTWTVPSDVRVIYLNGAAAGGSGGGGQAGGNTAGSAGGGAGTALENQPCDVTPGATITITMTVPSVQTAVGVNGADGANTTIIGCLEGGTITLQGGHGGPAASGGTGATGAASSFFGRIGGGSVGAAAGTGAVSFGNNGIAVTAVFGHMWDGNGSGGGGNTAGTAGNGGNWPSKFTPSSAGSGNGAGAGGGASYYGAGQAGTAATVDCAASPTWLGYGGGGCGAGSGGKGGPGGPPFVLINYFTATGL